MSGYAGGIGYGMILVQAIYVAADLPRAATGKIQRHRLREAEPAATS